MSPEETLRQIVADARGHDLEDIERAVRSDLGIFRPEIPTPRGAMTGPYTEWLIRKRAEWKAASDLLERLLEGRRSTEGAPMIGKVNITSRASTPDDRELFAACPKCDGFGKVNRAESTIVCPGCDGAQLKSIGTTIGEFKANRSELGKLRQQLEATKKATIPLSPADRERFGRYLFELWEYGPTWKNVSEESRETYRKYAESLIRVAGCLRATWIPVVGDRVQTKCHKVPGTIKRVSRDKDQILLLVDFDNGGRALNFDMDEFEPIV